MKSILYRKNKGRKQDKTEAWEDSCLCLETSNKKAIQEFHLRLRSCSMSWPDWQWETPCCWLRSLCSPPHCDSSTPFPGSGLQIRSFSNGKKIISDGKKIIWWEEDHFLMGRRSISDWEKIIFWWEKDQFTMEKDHFRWEKDHFRWKKDHLMGRRSFSNGKKIIFRWEKDQFPMEKRSFSSEKNNFLMKKR